MPRDSKPKQRNTRPSNKPSTAASRSDKPAGKHTAKHAAKNSANDNTGKAAGKRPSKTASKPTRGNKKHADPAVIDEASTSAPLASTNGKGAGEPSSEKLQKVLANNGVGSRREMERWIEEGRVSINGKLATLGDRVEPHDQLRVDGHVVSRQLEKSACRVLMYNKPEGELCSRHDPEGRATVFDRLPVINSDRWIAVGRLDINTSGLLLFTNDGELANRLMHPKHEIEREYAVRIFGEVTPAMLRTLQKGVELEDGWAKFTHIHVRKGDDESLNQWFNVTLSEGKNREVRRLWESQGVQVSRLMRVRYGLLDLQKRLPQGAWVELELDRVNQLRQMVKLPKETETVLKLGADKLDHTKLSRMRRSVKKHKIAKIGQRSRSQHQR